jgi:hypothetical protein
MKRTNVDFLANELVRKIVYFLILRQSLLFQRGLRAGFAVVSLLELRVPIPPVAWLFVFCWCCVLSGKVPATDQSPLHRSPTECVCHWLWSGATITFYTYNE